MNGHSQGIILSHGPHVLAISEGKEARFLNVSAAFSLFIPKSAFPARMLRYAFAPSDVDLDGVGAQRGNQKERSHLVSDRFREMQRLPPL